MHYFTTQTQPAKTLRAGLYTKRRKLGADVDDHVSLSSHEEEDENEDGVGDDYIPPAPFPHAPARTPRDKDAPARVRVQEELANMPSPIYIANPRPGSSTLTQPKDVIPSKKRHLSVLSTVMHRCLLEGDYERAGRAWGIILRTQVAGGQPVDPRNHGRWGVGAEILMRRRPQPLVDQSELPATASHHTHADMFSLEGLALARHYYANITGHYQHNTAPHAVHAGFFYPAMYSLWIFEICERSRRARQEFAQQRRSSRGRASNRDKAAIKRKELDQANELAESLQTHLRGNFDRDPNLLLLRGNVCLWISDLIAVTSISDGQSGIDTEELEGVRAIRRELLQAYRFMHKAVTHGAQVHDATFSKIKLKFKGVNRRFLDLGGSLEDDKDESYEDDSQDNEDELILDAAQDDEDELLLDASQDEEDDEDDDEDVLVPDASQHDDDEHNDDVVIKSASEEDSDDESTSSVSTSSESTSSESTSDSSTSHVSAYG